VYNILNTLTNFRESNPDRGSGNGEGDMVKSLKKPCPQWVRSRYLPTYLPSLISYVVEGLQAYAIESRV